MDFRAFLLVASCSVLIAAAGPAPGDDTVFARIPSVSGEPGEEVAVEFRADIPLPIALFQFRFDLSKAAAEYLRVDVAGTASAGAPPTGIWYDPHFFSGGYVAGIKYRARNDDQFLQPGDDLLLIEAVFRIRADAPVGEYQIVVDEASFTSKEAWTMPVELAPPGSLIVESPAGPRPVGDLAAIQVGEEVRLSWKATEAWDAVRVERDGVLLAEVGGTETAFTDRPAPGLRSYRVTALRAGKSSLPATCEILVQVARPPGVRDLACAMADGEVRLDWTNGAAYEAIAIFRNEKVVAALPGDAVTFTDSFTSDLYTVYTVQGRVDGTEAQPASCRLNEQSGLYVYRAEEVRAAPGSRMVPVRVFATNPTIAQGMQIAFRIDPALAAIRELSIDGMASEEYALEFMYQVRQLETGETACGIYYESGPMIRDFPAGAERPVLTVVVDVRDDVPDGTVIPVELGWFGSPPLPCSVTYHGESQTDVTEVRPGAILVGSSPVPEVKGATAVVRAGEPGPGGGDVEAGAVLLRWTNAAAYSSIRIERDARAIAEIAGADLSYSDPSAGPGLHRYRIVARQGVRESFPAVVAALPSGVPGTFLRGDGNRDHRVDIADPIATLSHLFYGGPQPPCLDGADADDSGRIDISDALITISCIFLGEGPLPEPGTDVPWFDPTPDVLGCAD
jgi:hypothetical protein